MHMSSKHDLTRAILPRYLKAGKQEKTGMLDELCANTGYHRDYAIWKLGDYQRHAPTGREGRPRKRRPKTYGPECLPALEQAWELLEYPCGKRLAPYLPEITAKLEACGELILTPVVREKLAAMSKNTVDRLLAPVKLKKRRGYQCTTKPGTLLKHQIPVRHERWPEDTVPGYTECDYVAHCGEVNAGDYVSTLSLTDISTTWMEHGAVLGKGQARTVAELGSIKERLPFRLRGIDPDNDGQFINWHLKRWCDARNIGFTRSRPYRKNDNAHVEQKNWSTVRQVLGYRRLDTEQQWQRVRELYAGPLREWQNFFLPTLKLKEKVREGARVIKRYDKARPPYQRVLESKHVPEEAKQSLRDHYATLNPVTLKRQVDAMVEEILTP